MKSKTINFNRTCLARSPLPHGHRHEVRAQVNIVVHLDDEVGVEGGCHRAQEGQRLVCQVQVSLLAAGRPSLSAQAGDPLHWAAILERSAVLVLLGCESSLLRGVS